MRLFVAIDLPREVREALARLAAELRPELPGLRWARPEGIHLTLRFLGEAGPDAARKVTDALLAGIAGRFRPMAIEVRGAGLFPERGRPRVLWAGVSTDGPLAPLRDAVESICVAAGFPPESRPFRPHLTLARCGEGKPQAGLAGVTARLAERLFGRFEAESIVLFESLLAPGGARYRPLATVAL